MRQILRIAEAIIVLLFFGLAYLFPQHAKWFCGLGAIFYILSNVSNNKFLVWALKKLGFFKEKSEPIVNTIEEEIDLTDPIDIKPPK